MLHVSPVKLTVHDCNSSRDADKDPKESDGGERWWICKYRTFAIAVDKKYIGYKAATLRRMNANKSSPAP